MTFRNPVNGYTREHDHPWLFCLLLGPIYFAALGIWKHAIFYVLAALTCVGWPIALVLYTILADRVVRDHYLSRGWIEVAL